MRQSATFAPEGGIPAYCTDAWSKEQVLSEPYRHVFFHTHAESVSGEDVWLKPPYASPLPLKRHGLRRAKARCCQLRKAIAPCVLWSRSPALSTIDADEWCLVTG